MRREIITLILATALLAGCTPCKETPTALYDSGVSLQLAQQRKESIKELAYSLFFSIPKEKSSPGESCKHNEFTDYATSSNHRGGVTNK